MVHLFELGKTVMSRGIADFIEEKESRMYEIIERMRDHHNGIWGDVSEEDKQANDDAIASGGRILSAYEVEGKRIWIITEADRSYTTVLFPEEY